MSYAGSLAQIARDATEPLEDFVEALEATESVAAPALGGTAMLAHGPLVDGNLTLASATTTYTPNTHYFEVEEGGFENVSIPPGTALTATYYYHGATSEQAISQPPEDWRTLALANGWTNGSSPAGVYREGQRAYLRGEIAGGTTAVGTLLFTLDADLSPSVYPAPLATLSAGGPVRLEVSPYGEVSIGDGPFEAGEWIILEGLSWRCREMQPAFVDWGETELFFGDEALDVTFDRLP